MNEKTVVAIDPGTSKCGMALVRRSASGDTELIWRGIVPPDEVVPKLREAYEKQPFQMIRYSLLSKLTCSLIILTSAVGVCQRQTLLDSLLVVLQ